MIAADPFSGVGQRSVMTDLVAWIASEVARHDDCPADVPPERALGLSSGRKAFLLPRRTVRLRLRHLPRRRGSGSGCRLCRK